mmetsp:Transcript_22866/g.34115  ORF Transcript_22866/g.34115 Transcript_22866/m.34115 type:complete len:471 (-) Transcript_22866:33-1445(-)
MASLARRCRRTGLLRKLCESRRSVHYQGLQTKFDLKSNVLEFPDQAVFAGTEALQNLIVALKEKSMKSPLIVTDKGVASLGVVADTQAQFEKAGISVKIFDECTPNPGVKDIQGIALQFLSQGCDSVIGFGGGGPLDAAKGAMALVAQHRVDSEFDIKDLSHAEHFVGSTCRQFSKHVESTKGFLENVPSVLAIPTTSGTGSDGGKSAVICDKDGKKVVFGHPKFMPVFAALVPQFTAGMPGRLTVGTGVDAMFHSLEAYLVPTDIMINRDGMTEEEIAYCDAFALNGIELVCRNLPKVKKSPQDLEARLEMQIAALYGAKAFRKGDLGGVHASAHAIGSMLHLHHGDCIARMSVPVLAYSEMHPNLPEDGKSRINRLTETIRETAELPSGDPQSLQPLLSDSIHAFLRPMQESGLVNVGIKDLVEKDVTTQHKFFEDLATTASEDGCQTNPVPLHKKDYERIFAMAATI